MVEARRRGSGIEEHGVMNIAGDLGYLGYVASALVLSSFLMRRMIPLRATALASNVAFIIYASELGLTPIVLLHSLLLPINLWRLAEAISAERATRRNARPAADATDCADDIGVKRMKA
jgi:hypothetical protein